MNNIEFQQDENTGIWVAEFTPTETGAILINREKSGQLQVKLGYDGMRFIPVDTQTERDYVAQIHIINVVVRIESVTRVESAKYTASIE